MTQDLLQDEMQREDARETMKMYGGVTLRMRICNLLDRCPGNGEPRWNKGINSDRKPEIHASSDLERQAEAARKIKNRNRSAVNLLIIRDGRGRKWLITTTEEMQPEIIKIKRILWTECQLRGESTNMCKWTANHSKWERTNPQMRRDHATG